MKSILVVVERRDRAHDTLARAVMLARHLGARLELFLCDAEPAYVLRHLYDARGAEEARQSCLASARHYLESLCHSVVAEDVRISIDVACESPLYKGILHKVLQMCPDLVIKGAGGGSANGDRPARSRALDVNDWQLVRTCPVPLLLVRGAPWGPRPQIGAAVDVSEEETPGLVRAILQMAGCIARSCNGDLDVLYGSGPTGAEGTKEQAGARRALQALADEFGVAGDRIHVVPGDPGEALPRFASEREYDLLALGALTHRSTLAALEGALTGRLLDTLDCDFLLVKPDGCIEPPLHDASLARAQEAG